jgi:ribonuclease-3
MVDTVGELAEFAERYELEFRDLALLRTALTHRSYLNEHPDPDCPAEDNERLEYLGDAVLDFLLAEYLYIHFPDAAEGELTELRAALVRRETLARFASELELGHLLLMGRGEAETGGRDRPATLCAAFEALVGALYLDQGLAGASRFVMPLVEQELAVAQSQARDQLDVPYIKDAKSRLQELSQGTLGLTPHYRTVKAEGPDHAKLFTVEVLVGKAVCGQGEGPSKQLAAQRAAADALARSSEWPVAPAREEQESSCVASDC